MTSTNYEPGILDEAKDLTHNARQKDYGHPRQDFDRIARLWSVVFGIEVQAHQVPLAMICVKISRQLQRRQRDNLVDIAGYANTADMLEED